MSDVAGRFVVRRAIDGRTYPWVVVWAPKHAPDEPDIYSYEMTRAAARYSAKLLNDQERSTSCGCSDPMCGKKIVPGVFKPMCESCDSRGWIHMNDSCGRGPGIECCDTCQRYETDDQAEKAHAKDCLCGMTCARD